MAKKRGRKKSITTSKIANVDKMGVAIAEFLATQGWDAHVVGPCEVRVQHAYNGGTRLGDATGKELAQYEFIAKFYGRRTPVPCPNA